MAFDQFNSTSRFSKTIEFYHKYRPDYPKQIIEILTKQCGLTPNKVIVDIGMGTGIFSQLLLENGNTVIGIEPNHDMLQQAKYLLEHYPTIKFIHASAEKTTLVDHTIDIITSAQAFHWFERAKTKHEFKRILKPNGWVILIWNLRNNDASAFMRGYEELLQNYGTDYKQVAAENVTDQTIIDFFHPNPVIISSLPNEQIVDWEHFKGRLLSTSYIPHDEDEPNFQSMLIAAKKLFDQHQQGEQVKFCYDTKIYFGKLDLD